MFTVEGLVVAIGQHYDGWFTARELVEELSSEALPASVVWRLEDGPASAAITMGMFLKNISQVRPVRVRGRRAWKLRAQ